MDCLSDRGRNTLNGKGFMINHGTKVLSNLYNEQHNPEGIINFGFAENCTCEEIVCEKVQSCLDFNPKTMYYYPMEGKPNFTNALATFLSERLAKGRELDPEKVIVISGVGAAFDLIGHTFADRGDCFLVLTPYYSAIESDLFMRAGVKLHFIHRPVHDTEGLEAFSFDEDLLERGFEEAVYKGHNVKGIFVINPCNPTGNILAKKDLETASTFAQKHDIHIIFDEIYALSVFGDDVEHTSALSIINFPQNDKSHVLWGFSKDFGISGIRCGVIYTGNVGFIQAAQMLTYFGGVPSVVQDALARMILDKDWLDKVYFPTNLGRMKENHDTMQARLSTLGIQCKSVKAGFFIYANLSKFLKEATAKEEMNLFEELMTAKIYLLPGTSFGSKEFGWFRITFTHTSKILQKGLDRLEEVLKRRS